MAPSMALAQDREWLNNLSQEYAQPIQPIVLHTTAVNTQAANPLFGIPVYQSTALNGMYIAPYTVGNYIATTDYNFTNVAFTNTSATWQMTPVQWIQPQQYAYPQWNYNYQPWTPQPAEAPEIIAARVARYEAERRKKDRANRVAEARAERLLLSHLTPAQVVEYKTMRRFRVLLQDGSEFIVEKGYSRNVFRIEDGKKVQAYCIHPSETMPDGDVMLAQKLMLESDRKAFERIAIKTAVHGGGIILAA